MGRDTQGLYPLGQSGSGHRLARANRGHHAAPGLEVVVDQEGTQDHQHRNVDVGDDVAHLARFLQGAVHVFGNEDGGHGAQHHGDAQLEVHVAQAPVLEHVDDGRAHYQGKAGADGVNLGNTEDYQSARNQEAAAHAEKAAQGTHNDTQQRQKDGINHHVGVRKQHIEP